MTSRQSSYYGLGDQYGWRSRYPNLDLRSSYISPALSSSLPSEPFSNSNYPLKSSYADGGRSSYIPPALSSSRPSEPISNSNYPLKSSYADGAPAAIQAPQKPLDYSRPLAFTNSSSASANNSFPYNYPPTVYSSSVYDFHILRKNIAHENANTKPKNFQTAKPVKAELRKISDIVADYDNINKQDLGLKSRNEKSLSPFNTSDNHGADNSRFSPRKFTIYRYNNNIGAYRIDIKFQRLSDPIGYDSGHRNKQEDQTQGYEPGKQHSLEDGGHKDLWDDYSNRGRKRAVTNCSDYDEDVQDLSCDYEIEYECSDDDDGNVPNSYRNGKKQKTARSSYESSDYEV